MRVSRRSRCLHAAWVTAALIGAGRQAMAASFTSGDLVVSSYGSPTVLTNEGASTPISLIEYSTSGGSPILTDVLPTADGVGGSSNLGIVGQYGSQSEGNLQLSGNNQYLTIGGYSATAAAKGIDGQPYESTTTSLAQSTDTAVPRLAALIDANENVNSSTELNDVYNTNNPRAVYSANGTSFYISGQGDGSTSDQGIFYGSPVGLNTVTTSNTPTGIYNAHDTRDVLEYNSNLYYSIDTSSGNFTGVWEFNGTPTASATATRIIPANGTVGGSTVNFSPDAFYFANSTTLYVADTGSPKDTSAKGDGGIQKWSLSGSTWSLDYTLTPTNFGVGGDKETGFEAITGEVVGANVELFAVSYTSVNAAPDGLYAIDDSLTATSLPSESFTELETAAGNGLQLFKGVSFAPTPVPEPASAAILGLSGLTLMGRRKRRTS